MSKYVRFCPNCNKKDPDYEHIVVGRYSTYLKEDDYACNVCGVRVEDLHMLSSDYKILVEISNNPKFIKSMIDLQQTDIIEYELKMSQFRTQAQQQKQAKQQAKQQSTASNKVQCPYCKSTNVKKISLTSKAVGLGVFGWLGASKVVHQYHCNNCKSDF